MKAELVPVSGRAAGVALKRKCTAGDWCKSRSSGGLCCGRPRARILNLEYGSKYLQGNIAEV